MSRPSFLLLLFGLPCILADQVDGKFHFIFATSFLPDAFSLALLEIDKLYNVTEPKMFEKFGNPYLSSISIQMSSFQSFQHICHMQEMVKGD